MMTKQSVALPEIPHMRAVTERCARLTTETRIETVASIIAGILHDAYAAEADLPQTPLYKLEPAVRRVYEGFGRSVAHSLLKPERTREAVAQAVEAAGTMLEEYDATDEALGIRGLSPDLRRERLERAVKAALHTYQTVMAREGEVRS